MKLFAGAAGFVSGYAMQYFSSEKLPNDWRVTRYAVNGFSNMVIGLIQGVVVSNLMPEGNEALSALLIATSGFFVGKGYRMLSSGFDESRYVEQNSDNRI